MSIFIKLTFPAGRYHATPWGRHVNEGVVEWPPSPWRLLRAIIAVWKRTCPEFSEQQVRHVLEPLVLPPRFCLPQFRVAHTRHYMPWEKKGPSDRTLVFDTFVSMNRRDPLIIGWPDANLSIDDRTILAKLLGNLSSLGRAEAWVHGELSDWAVELPIGEASPDDPNPVSVLCPDPLSAFGSEHYPPIPDAKKIKKGLKPNELLFDCPRWHLCLDTQTIHGERWPSVPGTKWLNYVRPTESAAVPVRPKRTQEKRFTIARFLLDGPVLPLVTNTVGVAEAFRRAAMGLFGQWCKRHPEQSELFRRTDEPEKFSSRVLAGKELDGTVRTDHCHAFYFPTSNGGDPRRITHVTMFAKDGFGPAEVAALSSMRELALSSESESLRVQLVGLGDPDDFNLNLFATSTVWESLTPFVVHRHFKQRGRKRDRLDPDVSDPRFGFIQLAAVELIERQFAQAPLAIERLEAGPGAPPAIDYRRFRDRRGDEARGRPFSFLRLKFPHPIRGPIALGYGCHFGLGLFAARDI